MQGTQPSWIGEQLFVEGAATSQYSVQETQSCCDDERRSCGERIRKTIVSQTSESSERSCCSAVCWLWNNILISDSGDRPGLMFWLIPVFLDSIFSTLDQRFENAEKLLRRKSIFIFWSLLSFMSRALSLCGWKPAGSKKDHLGVVWADIKSSKVSQGQSDNGLNISDWIRADCRSVGTLSRHRCISLSTQQIASLSQLFKQKI